VPYNAVVILSTKEFLDLTFLFLEVLIYRWSGLPIDIIRDIIRDVGLAGHSCKFNTHNDDLITSTILISTCLW